MKKKKRTVTAISRNTAASNRLLRLYGITLADYNRMLRAQNGKCAICKQPPKKTRLGVDHQHHKGYKLFAPEYKRLYVRGLLCYRCNKFQVGRHTNLTIQAVYDYLMKREATGL